MERLLDKAGQRAQEVERGAAQAVEETAAVAAEEGEVPLPPRAWAEPLGTWGAWQKEQQSGAHRGRGCWNVGWRGGSRRGGNGGAGRGHRGRRSLRPRARHGLGAGENALPAPAGQRSANNMNDATQPQHFTLRSSSTSGSPASSRASSQSGFRVQAVRTPWPSHADAGACLRPALTSWRETLRLLKKIKTLLGKCFWHGFGLQNAISVVRT